MTREPISQQQLRAWRCRISDTERRARRANRRHLDKSATYLLGHPLAASLRGDEPFEVLASRFQRTFAGISRALRRRMPPEIRRSGKGSLVVEWNLAGVPRAVFRWEGGEPDSLDVAVRRSSQLFGGFSETAVSRLTPVVLADLFRARAPLPEFSLTGNLMCAQWGWARRAL